MDGTITVREPKSPAQSYAIELHGAIDLLNAAALADELRRIIDRGFYALEIDLAEVDHVDSTGLGALVGGFKRVKQHGGTIRLRNMSPHLRRIFDVTGIAQVLDLA